MRQVLIDALKHQRASGQHSGLLLQRYLFKRATGNGGDPDEKKALLQAAIRAAMDPDVRALYQTAFERWSQSLDKLPHVVKDGNLRTNGRLIVGLGSENVLEAGIRLNHLYGTPIIPGSALKGLAAHYCDWVWGERDDEDNASPESKGWRREKGEYHRLLFGTTDDGGCIVFHDAWLIPGSSEKPLALDVMTPHHSGWNDLKNLAPPTDFDSPTPVPFLSATGAFHVAVSWSGPQHEQAPKWTKLALDLLREALEEWGAGGKTTSGYGRLAVPPPPPPPKPRAHGTIAKVTIIAPRPKGGYEVQDVEPGRAPGTLTLGSPRPGVEPKVGDKYEVVVHVEDMKRPQYAWPRLQ